MRGGTEPDLRGQRQASCPSLCYEVQAHPMKARLLGSTKASIGNLAPDARAVGVSVLGQHHGQGVNQMVNLRQLLCGQSVGQDRTESLKSRLQAVQAQDESLIAR